MSGRARRRRRCNRRRPDASKASERHAPAIQMSRTSANRDNGIGHGLEKAFDVAAGAAAGIAIVISALASGAAGDGNRFAQGLDEWENWQPGQAAQTSTGWRLEFYRNSLDIARGHPLIGTGTGSFPKVYADHVAGTAMAATANPHNEYLNIAVQLGVVGLLVMLHLFYREWRVADELTTTHERQLAHGLVITFVIGCLFNSLLMDHAEGLLFAWASGLLFGGLKSPANSGAPAR